MKKVIFTLVGVAGMLVVGTNVSEGGVPSVVRNSHGWLTKQHSPYVNLYVCYKRPGAKRWTLEGPYSNYEAHQRVKDLNRQGYDAYVTRK